MEAFENVGSPVAYSWGNDTYGPIHYNTNYFIFAECGSCSENFDEENEIPIDNTEQCIFQDDILGECFLVTYSSESEGSICVIQDFELLNAESCAEAEANGVPYCEEGCPADLIQPFWCINDGYCTTGFFSNTSNTDVLMNENDVLYLQYNYSNFTNCYLTEENNGEETIPESWLCPDCFVDENAIDIPGCLDEGCGCTVLLTCGTEELLIEGAITIEYEDGQDQQYACPELCHEGYYCIKRKKCDLGADYGAYLIEESISTELSFINQECIPDGFTNPVEGSCTYQYYCDANPTHAFCVEDCNSNLYNGIL
ncbi:MAG: hypothetical protein KDD10_04690 [Phaeodactylibacter sp.]|nr:hypothetical protein [Phaeodactylibacter sp.]